jgi:hypothetical protein
MIVQVMWKNLLNPLSIIAKHQILCVLIYYNNCKIEPTNYE